MQRSLVAPGLRLLRVQESQVLRRSALERDSQKIHTDSAIDRGRKRSTP